MPKTASGEQITWKEFFKRWGKGIEGITPYQQTKIQVKGNWISIIGIVAGIIVTSFKFKSYWWVVIILAGAFINMTISQIGLIQKKNLLKNLEGGLDKNGY